jgi:hypothetical protein
MYTDTPLKSTCTIRHHLRMPLITQKLNLTGKDAAAPPSGIQVGEQQVQRAVAIPEGRKTAEETLRSKGVEATPVIVQARKQGEDEPKTESKDKTETKVSPKAESKAAPKAEAKAEPKDDSPAKAVEKALEQSTEQEEEKPKLRVRRVVRKRR